MPEAPPTLPTATAPLSRRLLPWVLLVIGIGALGAHQHEFLRMDVWGWLAIATLGAAPFVGLRNWPSLRWLVASIPFWMFGNALDWLLLVAVALSMASLIAVALVPTLVGRRVRPSGKSPLPHLSGGPLVPVAPQVFPGGRRSRVLTWLAVGGCLAALVNFVLLAAGMIAPELAALGIAALIMAAVFTFANWFADRVRVRVDDTGVHGRVLFVEHTAKWTDITGLRLRYLFMPGYGLRLVYYVVESPRHEVSFPSSMAGAGELQATIERATGLKWPPPSITPTM